MCQSLLNKYFMNEWERRKKWRQQNDNVHMMMIRAREYWTFTQSKIKCLIKQIRNLWSSSKLSQQKERFRLQSGVEWITNQDIHGIQHNVHLMLDKVTSGLLCIWSLRPPGAGDSTGDSTLGFTPAGSADVQPICPSGCWLWESVIVPLLRPRLTACQTGILIIIPTLKKCRDQFYANS